MASTSSGADDGGRAETGGRGPLTRYLDHESVAVRAAAVWALCLALFFATWTLGYYALPEGLLRGSLGADAPVVGATVASTFARIFAWNLALGALPVVAFNLLRSVHTPVSYVVLALTWAQGGLVYGTNSLGIQAGRLAPSVLTLVSRSGLYELSAYVLFAVATRSLYLWHQQSGPRWREEFERVRSPRDWSFTRAELATLLVAVALLALANYREAAMIHALG